MFSTKVFFQTPGNAILNVMEVITPCIQVRFCTSLVQLISIFSPLAEYLTVLAKSFEFLKNIRLQSLISCMVVRQLCIVEQESLSRFLIKIVFLGIQLLLSSISRLIINLFNLPPYNINISNNQLQLSMIRMKLNKYYIWSTTDVSFLLYRNICFQKILNGSIRCSDCSLI